MNMEQNDRNHKSLHFKLGECEFGSVLFTTRSAVSVTMVRCNALHKGVNGLSDQWSFDVSSNTKEKITIPRNICGRIWNSFIAVISYL